MAHQGFANLEFSQMKSDGPMTQQGFSNLEFSQMKSDGPMTQQGFANLEFSQLGTELTQSGYMTQVTANSTEVPGYHT